jgi:protein TonB
MFALFAGGHHIGTALSKQYDFLGGNTTWKQTCPSKSRGKVGTVRHGGGVAMFKSFARKLESYLKERQTAALPWEPPPGVLADDALRLWERAKSEATGSEGRLDLRRAIDLYTTAIDEHVAQQRSVPNVVTRAASGAHLTIIPFAEVKNPNLSPVGGAQSPKSECRPVERLSRPPSNPPQAPDPMVKPRHFTAVSVAGTGALNPDVVHSLHAVETPPVQSPYAIPSKVLSVETSPIPDANPLAPETEFPFQSSQKSVPHAKRHGFFRRHTLGIIVTVGLAVLIFLIREPALEASASLYRQISAEIAGIVTAADEVNGPAVDPSVANTAPAPARTATAELAVAETKTPARSRPTRIQGKTSSPPVTQPSVTIAATARSAAPVRIIAPAPTIQLSQAESNALLARTVAPTYPDIARAQGLEGDVTLRALVDERGYVARTDPLVGDDRLVASALQAVSRWRYRPYVRDGHAQPFETVVVLHFSLAR